MLLFAPGAGASAEVYENFITELVSRGYIVVATNTPFLNLVALPNGHIIKPVKQLDVDKFLQLQIQDLTYVLTQIKNTPNSNPVFAAMDTKRIGMFGHSIGGLSVATLAQEHSNWFQAIATLDMSVIPGGIAQKKFIIPCMHMVRADKLSQLPPGTIELGNYGYLVILSPNEQDLKYSDHMNFSDYSTIQYLPAAQLYTKHTGDGPLLGNGNGWEITDSINTYLVQFFNMFFKYHVNEKLLNCIALTNNTYMQCGSNIISTTSSSSNSGLLTALGITGVGIAAAASDAYLSSY